MFTQTALRAYRECPYRFRLRYLEGVPWPAAPTDPAAERALDLGRRFHELARQHYLGLEVDEQARSAGPPLADWWQALRTRPPDLAGYPERYPEVALSVPLGRFRLSARYDLLAIGEKGARIVDWKIGVLPLSPVLAQDLQTQVYLYVLAEGNTVYRRGRLLAPESLSLVYWNPRETLLVGYDARTHAQTRAFLEGLVDEIAQCDPAAMRPVEDPSTCSRCGYAALCGLPSGGILEWEEEEEEAFPEWPPEEALAP